MLNFPDKKYQIIYVDPAWEYEDKALAGNRGACCKYDVMSNAELKKLPIQKIADENCILFCWATYPKLSDALDLISSWNFTYKTVGFTWVKTNKKSSGYFMGMGRWTRANPEIVLLATKGKPKRLAAGITNLIVSPVQEHSKKPNIIRDKIIQLVGDLPRIELFARTKIHGWDVWGNDPKLQNKPLEVFS
jgi:N6-adenosine-specific RNA methylase IME4